MRTFLALIFYLIVIPLLPVLLSGRWKWWQVWIFFILSFFGFATSRILAARRHPDLIQERGKFLHHPDTKPFDKILSPLVALGGVLIPLVAGLEARFEPLFIFGVFWNIFALLFILAGYLFSSWALLENPFFSGVVRIQKERGHHTVSTGPYRFVRHPGYSGGLIAYLAMPVVFDSVYSFIPVLFLSAILVLRTFLEDRTLQKELDGYEEYAKNVHFRLIPGVW